MAARRDWSDEENMALCLAYCIMLSAQLRGEKFNKSAIRRELIGTDTEAGPLHARSNGAIEAKFMNCSAIVQQARLPGMVKGYKAANNVQAALLPTLRNAWELVRDDAERGIATTIDVAVA